MPVTSCQMNQKIFRCSSSTIRHGLSIYKQNNRTINFTILENVAIVQQNVNSRNN